MRSLLFRTSPVVPFVEPPGCQHGRQEVPIVIRKGGKLIRAIARDKVLVDDPFLMMVRAVAFSIKQKTDYNAQPIPRNLRDFLIKTNVGVV